jgi:SAM-dependent methyltransferase
MPEIDEARRVSFDTRAERYDTARPSYPDALADDVISIGGRRVLEIGAGTGKATVVFARRGASIVALEPGASLAALLRRNTHGSDVTVVETTFEAWPIERRFDVVMSAQAIHWIDPAVRYTKAAAVLDPGGMLAVVRNENAIADPELRTELDTAYARWHAGNRGDGGRSLEDEVESSRRDVVGDIDASGLFGAVDMRRYPWTATYTTQQYLDLIDTYSDHATLPEERRAGLYQAIAAVLDRRGGTLTLPYMSLVFLAPRRDQGALAGSSGSVPASRSSPS